MQEGGDVMLVWDGTTFAGPHGKLKPHGVAASEFGLDTIGGGYATDQAWKTKYAHFISPPPGTGSTARLLALGILPMVL